MVIKPEKDKIVHRFIWPYIRYQFDRKKDAINISFQIHNYKSSSASVTASRNFEIMTVFLFYQNLLLFLEQRKNIYYYFYMYVNQTYSSHIFKADSRTSDMRSLHLILTFAFISLVHPALSANDVIINPGLQK